MINSNDIRWEDFGQEDQKDMLELRDAIIVFEKEVRVYEVNLFCTIAIKTTYTVDIMDFFQFSTYPEVIDFSYDTFGKELSPAEQEWLDDLSSIVKGRDFSELLEKKLDTSHLKTLKEEVCERISQRNNIPVSRLKTDFFLDYDIVALTSFGD